jgi:hypothetical protein
MTPFRNDDENPFGRDRAWPKMPQTPLSVSPGRAAPSRYAPALGLDGMAGAASAEPEPSPAPDIEFEPLVFSRPRRMPPSRRGLRLAPLVAAAAVGVGGLLTLFLVIGTGPRP